MVQVTHDYSVLAPGFLVRLAVGTSQSQLLRTNVIDGRHFVFSCIGEKGNLKIGPKGAVGNDGGNGPWARFLVAQTPDGRVQFKSLGHSNAGRDVYLGATPQGAGLKFISSESAPGLFDVVVASGSECAACDLPVSLAAPSPRFELSEEMKRTFVNEGYLRLPGLVGAELVEAALRAINAQLGLGAAAWDEPGPNGQPMLGGGLGQSVEVLSLLYASPAYGVVQQLLGPGASKPKAGQIALRFPTPPSNPGKERGEEQWHIDGQDKHEHLSPFDMLLGVALSAQPTDDCGNLALWPGTHTKVHAAVCEHRHELAAAPHLSEEQGWLQLWQAKRPKLKDERVMQVHMEPGDVVLAHQKLPHRVSLNRSPHVRYQVYFRLSAHVHKNVGFRQLDEMLWEGFEGVHAVLPKA